MDDQNTFSHDDAEQDEETLRKQLSSEGVEIGDKITPQDEEEESEMSSDM